MQPLEIPAAAKARTHLGELAAMARQNEDAERKILARAEELLDNVNKKIAAARPGVEAAPADKQTEYQDLVAERGRLLRVIANAKRVLGTG